MRIDRHATGLMRHIRACNNAVLPGERLAVPASAPRRSAGWQPALADALAVSRAPRATGTAIVLADGAALPALARALSDRGLLPLAGRGVRRARATPDGPVLARARPRRPARLRRRGGRGACERAGRRRTALHLWVARRAADKALDPGKLDHLVAGGVPAGLTPGRRLIKEAEEEAAIPPGAGPARAGTSRAITYAMERPRGCGGTGSTATTSSCRRTSSRAARRRGGELRALARSRARAGDGAATRTCSSST